MKKVFITAIFAAFLAIANTQGVSAAPKNIENPGVLPTNPFYFIKEWKRNVQLILVKDPVRRAEIEIGVLVEKIHEVTKLQETRKDSSRAMIKALQVLKQTQEQLRGSLVELRNQSREASESVIERAVKYTESYEQVIQSIADNFKDEQKVQGAVNEIYAEVKMLKNLTEPIPTAEFISETVSSEENQNELTE